MTTGGTRPGREPDGGEGEVHGLLKAAVAEAARLLDADGAMVYLLDPATEHLRFAHDAGIRSPRSRDFIRSIQLPVGVGMFGRAVAERAVVSTGAYLDDPSFDHAVEPDQVVRDVGIRSMVVAPLVAGDDVFGALGTFSSRDDAFTSAQIGLVRALADHAAAAMHNVRLIEDLDTSRRELAERADVERTLRVIAARITVLRDPTEILKDVVAEAGRLVRGDGVILDLLDPVSGNLHWAMDDGLGTQFSDEERSKLWIAVGVGATGIAVAEDRVVVADDDLVSQFPPAPESTEFYERTGFHSMIAAPITGEAGALGVIEVYSKRTAAFSAADASVVQALASQAAIAITNARLIEELDRSRAAVAHRADTERALRDITARIAALREPDVILRRVVEEARRLLRSDGAHLTRISETRTYLVPVVVAGLTEVADQEWLLNMEFPIGGGINGLAAERGEPVWTADYRLDDRIPHDADDVAVAQRLGLCGMAAAPLQAPGGEVIGTLAVSSSMPRQFTDEELDLLQGLADQAAIAITNSTLLTRLTESEARYRYLVERAPDLVWSIGSDARLTFLSDAVVRLTGRKPEELLGRHFGALLHESSSEIADFDWTTGMRQGSQEVRGRVNLAGPEGEPVPAEFIAAARLDEDGRFLGANGSVRDMREQVRLEQELRESEARYRFLVENAPDVVFSTNAEGRLTFVSDALERLAGWRPDEVVGQPYSTIVDSTGEGDASSRWAALMREPAVKQIAVQRMRRSDGSVVPVEISAIGIVDEAGRFAGVHGSTRDISERIRFERDLRRQAGELAAGEERAHLARELHDSVTQALFSMTLVSRSVEMLLERDPDAARAHLVQLRELQREALAEMRALIFELRPGNIEQDGLARALRTHSAALQGRIGLPVVVDSNLVERLPLPVEETLYRIAQEALHNVVKHAGAAQVRVEVERSAGGARLRVEDDGKGFDPERVPAGHLGLAGMRARADRIGARFSCRSEPGKGATIEVFVPEAAIALAAPRTGPAESSAIRDE